METSFSCSTVLFAVSQYLSTHFFACPPMSFDQAVVFASDFSQPRNFSVALADVDPRFEHISVLINHTFVRFTFTLSAQEKMEVLPDQRVSSISSTWDRGFASFQPMYCHPRLLREKDLADDAQNKHSQFGTFSPSNFFRLSFPQSLQLCGHTDFAQEEPLVLPVLDHDVGHLCRGRRIHMSGHADL